MADIITIISLWIGRFFVLTFMLFSIVAMFEYMFRKFESHNVYFKALCYHILSQKKMFKDEKDKLDIRVGRKWFTKFKGKWIEWEIISIKDQTK